MSAAPGGGHAKHQRSPLPPLVPLVPTDSELATEFQRYLPPLVPFVPPTYAELSRHQRALPPLVPPRAVWRPYRALSPSDTSDDYQSERLRRLPPLVPSRGHLCRGAQDQQFLPPLVPPKLYDDDYLFKREDDISTYLNQRLQADIRAEERGLAQQGAEDGTQQRRLAQLGAGDGTEEDIRSFLTDQTNEEETRFDRRESSIANSGEKKRFEGRMNAKDERGGKLHPVSRVSSRSEKLEKPVPHGVVIFEPDYTG